MREVVVETIVGVVWPTERGVGHDVKLGAGAGVSK